MSRPLRAAVVTGTYLIKLGGGRPWPIGGKQGHYAQTSLSEAKRAPSLHPDKPPYYSKSSSCPPLAGKISRAHVTEGAQWLLTRRKGTIPWPAPPLKM